MAKVLLLVMLGIFSCQSALGQNIEAPYEVATWRGFAESAVSHTWDDNTPKQLSDAMPLYDAFDFKVTFFTTMRWLPNWIGLRAADANRHEVASHTMTHSNFSNLTDEEERKEQKNSQEVINQNIGNNHCITMAYPYCVSGHQTITSEYYISARGCSGQIETKTPKNFMNISSIVCGTEGSVETSSDFNGRVDDAANSGGWCVFLLHGINDDGGYSPVTSRELFPHLKYLDTNRDRFWVETYGNVVKYIKERDAVSLVEISNEDDLITVSLTHNLTKEIFNYPITIKRPMPAHWEDLFVSQNGRQLDSKIVNEDEKHMVFDAVPNGGNILISNSRIVTD